MGKTVSEVQLFGTRGSPAAYSIRDFLQRSDLPFRWVELTTDEQARTEANVEGLSDATLPVCIFPDGTRLERPTVRQVTEKLRRARPTLYRAPEAVCLTPWYSTSHPLEVSIGADGMRFDATQANSLRFSDQYHSDRLQRSLTVRHAMPGNIPIGCVPGEESVGTGSSTHRYR
jgi:hypothetical protein